MEYRYILDRGAKKFPCPACKKLRFVRFIDRETGEYCPPDFGRCDREINCGFFNKPNNPEPSKFIPKLPPKKTYFLPEYILESTLGGFQKNGFIQSLLKDIPFPLPAEEVYYVARLYLLGTIPRGLREGATCFPFVDFRGNVRAIQVKTFGTDLHTTGTDWIHSLALKKNRNGRPLPEWLVKYVQNEKYVSCLFGELLLKRYPAAPVAIVEAPKTAVISSLYFGLPDDSPRNFVWLAAFNVSSLTPDKCKALRGRDVVLFPDLKAFDFWRRKAEILNREIPGASFQVSKFLENEASPDQKAAGLDLADFLLPLDWRQFRKTE